MVSIQLDEQPSGIVDWILALAYDASCSCHVISFPPALEPVFLRAFLHQFSWHLAGASHASYPNPEATTPARSSSPRQGRRSPRSATPRATPVAETATSALETDNDVAGDVSSP